MANPRAEAEDILGGDYEARVLEPSPPAVTEDPWTDDPVEPGEVPEGRDLVSPVHNRGDLTWDEITRQEPDLGPWCAERWLGAWKRLEPVPASFAETRDALHKVAEAVVSPARQPPNEISLRYTRGGFGTPFFEQDGLDCQVRVEHGELVRQRGLDETTEPLPPEVDAAAASALGDFYGFACSVLEQLRADEVGWRALEGRALARALRHRDRPRPRVRRQTSDHRSLPRRREPSRALPLRHPVDGRGLG